ncbi:MAG TPA: hypothetical protein VMI31_03220 [Fimbriimonadaceae bacterium]|nr:hypothetical protein [Fimbriimonadaceae bacterium]
MTYYVLDDAGNAYGPADEAMLRQWVQEGRIQPNTNLRDAGGATMLASAVPGLFAGSYPPSQYGPPTGNPYDTVQPGPYADPQPGGPVPGYAYYPRPAAQNSNDVTVAWVMSIAGIVCAFCVCALVGVGLGIGGLVFARRAAAAGDPRAQGPMVASYVAIGIGVVMVIVSIFELSFFRMG